MLISGANQNSQLHTTSFQKPNLQNAQDGQLKAIQQQELSESKRYYS